LTKKDEDSLHEKGQVYRKIAIDARRSKRLAENERSLIELIQSLDKDYPNLLVIVEGKRDVRVLRNLGLKAPIIKTQTRLSRSRLIEKILVAAGKEGQVLILTDYDKEGKDLYKFIREELELAGVKHLRRERGLIRRYMEDWTTIEQLVALFKRRDSPEASR
jgi:5S rRNA maturation endonuclease (ribonuclease M5)